MKMNYTLFAFAFLLIFHVVFSGCSKIQVTKTEKGLIIAFPDGIKGNYQHKMALELISPEIVKIAVSTSDSCLNAPSLVVTENFGEKATFSVTEKTGRVELSTDSLLVSVELPSGKISFHDRRNRLLLSATGSEILPFKNEFAGKQNHIVQHFDWQPGEALFGLGQHRHGQLNLRGLKIELVQENIEVAVPFLLSTNGYGLLWDNYSRTVFNDFADSSYFWSDIGDKIQYYFIKGKNFDELVARNRELTGEAPMYPRWALGYMQSRNRYRSEAELMGVVKKQRGLKIPLDVIILDYYHWGNHGFGSFVFDEKDFQEPEKMIKTLHEKYNCKLLVSAWPSFTPKTKNWELMNEKGYLLDVMASFNSQVYDAYHPAAGKLYYDLLKDAYLDKGVDGWWFDATEPENRRALYKSRCYLGDAARYMNIYSYFGMKNVYENQLKDSDKRIFILTRSGFTGQQKFGTTVWSGDIETNFAELKKQIPAGLNFCMSGIPYWTTDIGGYKGGNPADPAYQEVFTRWFQYGAFCPVFRAHGRRYPGDRTGPNEMWSFGTEKQKILTDYINLRYRLLPYIYSLSALVTSDGFTIMRGLPFDFINDPRVYNIMDQFMFGKDFLVCPVTEAGATSRPVYLPEGCRWFDFRTGKEFNGGQEITADSPIETMPLFVKAGSIIPMGPVVQYSTEKPADPIELRVYPGADASFTLYEDENDNFNYRNGKYQKITFRYNDSEKTLTISKPEGSFPGSLVRRTFHVVKVGEGSDTAPQTVDYPGEEMVVKL
jgi:alpha-D-xyloside xylohydrolase